MRFQPGGRRPRRHSLFALTGVALLAIVSACTQGGTPRAQGDVGGLPVTNFKSGLRENAPTPDIDVRNVTGSKEDRLATAAIADVVSYWSKVFPKKFDEKFQPVGDYISYDPDGRQFEVCQTSTSDVPMNAFYCPPDDAMAWDRAQLLPILNQQFGPMAISTVLAHEYGHAVQSRLGDKAGFSSETKSIVAEQQADCFAGNYIRWTAEGDSDYFKLSTSEGLNEVLSALFFVRDPPGLSPGDNQSHGTAFDRAYAFQLGFTDGPERCAEIDEGKIQKRVTEAPYDPGDQEEGYTRVTEETLDLLQESLDSAFERTDAESPRIVSDSTSCSEGPNTSPASYCPDSNEVHVDLPELAQLGRPLDKESAGSDSDSGLGDFAAYAEVASRYVLGIQQGVDMPLDDQHAALRTACLVGTWADTAGQEGQKLRLSSGDLDEAIAELLQPKSLIAADVNGHQVPNGFSRVKALRQGYLKGSSTCTEQYS